MQSKNSLLNKALIKKDLTRFWPVWAVEMVMLFFLYMRLSEEIRDMQEYAEAYYTHGLLHAVILPVGILAITFSIITAAMIFGYLGDRREAYLTHSFPIKRQTLFWSHYLSGFLMILVPDVIFYLLFVCVLPAGQNSAPYLLVLFLQILAGVFVCYNLACVSILLTANRISGIVIYGVSNILAYAVVLGVEFVGYFMIYGGSDAFFSFDIYSAHQMILNALTPAAFWNYDLFEVEYLGKKGLLSYTWIPESFGIFFILIPAVLLLVAGYYLYKKRAIETAGDIIAFSWAKPVYKIVFTACFSFLLENIILFLMERSWARSEYYHMRSFLIVGLMAGAVLGYFVVTMIMEKTFFIWKEMRWHQVVLPAVCMLIAVYVVKWTGGFMVLVPDSGAVSFVEVDFGYEEEDDGVIHGNSLYFTDIKEIDALDELTRSLIDEQEDLRSSAYDGEVDITYHMKAGESLYRSYDVLEDTDSVKKFKAFCMEKNLTKRLFLDGKISYQRIDLSDQGHAYWIDGDEEEEDEEYGSSVEALALCREYGKLFYEAIEKDEAAGHRIYLNRSKDSRYSLSVQIQYRQKDQKSGYTHMEGGTVELYVSEGDTYTMQVVKKMIEDERVRKDTLRQ